MPESNQKSAIPFKAETRQILDILIHSLYNEREVFLRELVSNASDALTRMNFEMLTNRNILDADAELKIMITADPEKRTLTVKDTGVGMTETELIENLGTIAQSGARNFIKAVEDGQQNVSDIIGQFGVGFYSAFMIADSIRVVSRSYQPDAEAAAWISSGEDTFSIEAAQKTDRGTEVVIQLKEDASEFAEEQRLREIIQRHSDYVPFPIYLNDNPEQVNHQTALWRQSPHQVDSEEYEKFYRQFSMNFEPPITYAHMAVDAPVQMYSLLFFPSTAEHNIFSARKQDGLKLYARKVLIQEYCQDLLPKCFRFVDGVVDSEDLPLNVSRESVQSTRVMGQLEKLITSKVIDTLKKLGEDEPEKYETFWKNFRHFIKEGIATDFEQYEKLLPLLRFYSLKSPDKWISLETYVKEMKEGQNKIYFLLGDENASLIHSPHLEAFRHNDYDVVLLSDPLDPFMLLRFKKFGEYELVNITATDAELPEVEKADPGQKSEPLAEDKIQHLIDLFKTNLGDRVSEVKTTDRLVESPARLVDPQGTLPQEMQRVYHLLEKEYQVPQKILEINPDNPILKHLAEQDQHESCVKDIVEQIYENALLIEGLHPDPASMILRIQRLMEQVLK